jgi:hypothetical protein
MLEIKTTSLVVFISLQASHHLGKKLAGETGFEPTIT